MKKYTIYKYKIEKKEKNTEMMMARRTNSRKVIKEKLRVQKQGQFDMWRGFSCLVEVYCVLTFLFIHSLTAVWCTRHIWLVCVLLTTVQQLMNPYIETRVILALFHLPQQTDWGQTSLSSAPPLQWLLPQCSAPLLKATGLCHPESPRGPPENTHTYITCYVHVIPSIHLAI